jgi:hypothetical protein
MMHTFKCGRGNSQCRFQAEPFASQWASMSGASSGSSAEKVTREMPERSEVGSTICDGDGAMLVETREGWYDKIDDSFGKAVLLSKADGERSNPKKTKEWRYESS